MGRYKVVATTTGAVRGVEIGGMSADREGLPEAFRRLFGQDGGEVVLSLCRDRVPEAVPQFLSARACTGGAFTAATQLLVHAKLP
ncbi:hypothetical protein [Streptomyces sp. OE57]|uniref:hypothetical protein n=1 Tax=Streptomyces lacaronensis TaxID=3379885 RepID=UPI0039B75B0B